MKKLLLIILVFCSVAAISQTSAIFIPMTDSVLENRIKAPLQQIAKIVDGFSADHQKVKEIMYYIDLVYNEIAVPYDQAKKEDPAEKPKQPKLPKKK